MLEFIAQHYPLFTSKSFLEFFEGAVALDPGREMKALRDEILQPTVIQDGVASQTSAIHEENHSSAKGDTHVIEASPGVDSSSASASRDPCDGGVAKSGSKPSGRELAAQAESLTSLGGVWQYRQTADNLSLSSDDNADVDDDENSFTTFTESESGLSTPLPSSDISLFDPLADASPVAAASNAWLLSAMVACAQLEKPEPQRRLDALQFPKAFSEYEDVETPKAEAPREFADADSLDMQEAGGVPDAPWRESSSSSSIPAPQPRDRGSMTLPVRSPQRVLGSKPSTPCRTPTSPAPQPLLSPEVLDINGKGAYIYEAANLISLAQENEADGQCRLSFQYYKMGVSLLLKGVQGDGDASRREAVRRKTAQYLMKAEDLYNNHLSATDTDNQRWGEDSETSPSRQYQQPQQLEDNSPALLEGPTVELGYYKVLGIIDKALLVLDSTSERTFALKVLSKTSSPTSSYSIVPTTVPHMVKLVRFYETDNAIFLVLELAAGGKLWSYVSSYLNQQASGFPHDDDDDDVFADAHEQRLRRPDGSAAAHSGAPAAAERDLLRIPECASGGSSQSSVESNEACTRGYAELFKNYASNVGRTFRRMSGGEPPPPDPRAGGASGGGECAPCVVAEEESDDDDDDDDGGDDFDDFESVISGARPSMHNFSINSVDSDHGFRERALSSLDGEHSVHERALSSGGALADASLESLRAAKSRPSDGRVRKSLDSVVPPSLFCESAIADSFALFCESSIAHSIVPPMLFCESSVAHNVVPPTLYSS
ncbi:PREDICTED: uncharacterized protein LOC106808279 [Priapulus caudatus]|uniref:Uncharacterized protein LOC106808279 n=1 Tax=Priapulus caudatus TaxID=37621 RepID=A0ABM1E2J0_PRICU|nr:PREDICTED: uncharacterized protein LOC106808279 [Priapulus caudatus]